MTKIVTLISANAEWRALKTLFPRARLQNSPFGEWFETTLAGSLPVTFLQGGWGKISAAASAQYAIGHFQPNWLVNAGTCGGFEGRIAAGALILVEKTIVYDIVEQMSDPQAAIRYYSAELDLSWLRQPLPEGVQRGLLVSADRDIVVQDIPMLVNRFGAAAADWESGAIAWTAQKNNTPCVILRGVSDLVGGAGGEAYGNLALFQRRTDAVMERLIRLLADWLAPQLP